MNTLNPHSPEAQQSPEQALRQKLVGEIVDESEGTVSLFTAADFSPEDSRSMIEAAGQRNPGQAVNPALSRNSGGWAEYGERPHVGGGNTLLDLNVEPVDEDHAETMRFVTMPNGAVEVRYKFNHRGYKDNSNRGNNTLLMGFALTEARALQLQEALRADPSFVNEVIKGQAMALGVSEKHWENRMQPSYAYGLEVPRPDKDRILNLEYSADGTAVDQQALVYGERKSIASAMDRMPTTQEQTPDSAPEQAPPAVAEADSDAVNEIYEDIKRLLNQEEKDGELGKEDIADWIKSLENEMALYPDNLALQAANTKIIGELKQRQQAAAVDAARSEIHQVFAAEAAGGQVEQHVSEMPAENDPNVLSDYRSTMNIIQGEIDEGSVDYALWIEELTTEAEHLRLTSPAVTVANRMAIRELQAMLLANGGASEMPAEPQSPVKIDYVRRPQPKIDYRKR